MRSERHPEGFVREGEEEPFTVEDRAAGGRHLSQHLVLTIGFIAPTRALEHLKLDGPREEERRAQDPDS
jgi:hypothetical protein